MKRALLALAMLAACAQANASPLDDEMRRLMADAAADLAAHEAGLALLSADAGATQEDFRAAFRRYNARRDAQIAHALDLQQRRKARVTPEQWEALPRLPPAEDGTTQELLGFMQTYDATPGDLKPVLDELRREAASREEQAIRARFPAAR